jgi:preprotein translocase subunit SecE
MANQTTTPPAQTPAKPRPSIGEFFRQVRSELAKVTWPTQKETLITTAMVLVMSVLAAIFFIVVDWAVSLIVRWILGFGG